MALDTFRYVTSSVGHVYRGYYAGVFNGYNVYACSDLSTKELVGFCACMNNGAFGPLCETYDMAVMRADNIWQARNKMINKSKSK